jgi:hypothetical protein
MSDGITWPRATRSRRALVAIVCAVLAGSAVAASGALSSGAVEGDGPGTTVLATGEAAVAGPWQLIAYTSDESAAQPAGLPCLRLQLASPPAGSPMDASGFCGELGKGFGAVSLPVVDREGAAEVLIFGLAPEGSVAVRLKGNDGQVTDASTREVPPAFTRGDVFVFSTNRASTGGALQVLDGEDRALAPAVAADGFFDQLRAVQRIGAGRR